MQNSVAMCCTTDSCQVWTLSCSTVQFLAQKQGCLFIFKLMTDSWRILHNSIYRQIRLWTSFTNIQFCECVKLIIKHVLFPQVSTSKLKICILLKASEVRLSVSLWQMLPTLTWILQDVFRSSVLSTLHQVEAPFEISERQLKNTYCSLKGEKSAWWVLSVIQRSRR